MPSSADSFAGRGQRPRHHRGQREDGGVAALAQHAGPAELVRDLAVRHLALARVQALVLEEDDRVRIPHGRGEQPDDVPRVRRGHDLQPGHRHGPVLHRLRVLGAEAQPGPVGAADHERQRELAVGHVPALGHLVGDQVPADREEVAEHDLGDRPQAGHRGAHRGAEDGLLADRGVADAFRPELLQQAGSGLEHPARRGDILAEEDHVGIAAHLLGDPPGYRVTVCNSSHIGPFGNENQFRQALPPSAHTFVAASSSRGCGPALASSVARSTASRALSSIASSTAGSTPRPVRTAR